VIAAFNEQFVHEGKILRQCFIWRASATRLLLSARLRQRLCGIARFMLFKRATAACLKDRQWHPRQRLEQGKPGELRMFLRVADTRELLDSIMSFSACVRVLLPDSLRNNARQEAKKIFKNF
jgi:predicted DNA-binding transcriptional regulator YafY